MKTKTHFLFILFLLFSSFLASQEITRPQRYWVTFYDNGRQMLMKIDQFGKIIVSPRPILTKGVVGNDLRWGAVISPGPSPETMNIWFQRGGYSIAEYRAVLNVHNFGIKKIKRLFIDSVNYSVSGFHVTQKDQNNFLTFHKRVGDLITGPLMAAGISNGQLDGSIWQISPKDEDNFEGGGVSRDGRMSFFTQASDSRSRLYLQRLRLTGKPKGSRALVKVSEHYSALYCFDVSNVLPGKRRMALYFHYVGGCGPLSHLQLRPVNAETGEPTGKAINLLHSYDLIPAALDESAQFVLYAIYDSLYYRQLDESGHKTGPPKLVFKGVDQIGFIDIMKE